MELNSSKSGSVNDFLLNCFHSALGVGHITIFTTFSVLLLPLSVFILYLGQQRWRQQRSTTMMSHSDCITYHVTILELISTAGSIVCCCGVCINLPDMITLGIIVLPMKLTGQIMFNILTCVESYLAVVHPVTYLNLRSENGIKVRNIVTGCVWGLSVASMGTVFIVDELALTISSCFTICTCVFLICFFSISVLCVLTRPKPGEKAGERQRVDQSKLRAFYTIMLILGLLLIRSGGNVLTIVSMDSVHLGKSEKCGLWFSVFWFCVPSSLVLPLMFLQRAGKLSLCMKNIKLNQTSK